MEILLSILIGIGLSAAAGFRIFVPFLVVGIAERSGHLALADGFDWIGSTPALITFGAATLLEVGAYYIPWLDNALDSLATPSAVVAGVILTASVVADLDPFMQWTLAVLAGGGTATVFQGVTTGTRQISTLTTAGFGNPLVSTGEIAASAGLSLLAVVVPIVAFLAVIALMFLVGRRVFFRRGPRQQAA
ncbi:MAG: DUF4126 domain-containing protein [Acidobacteriota bacterium]